MKLMLKPTATNYHTIFVKEHSIHKKDPNKPKGRTLFILNIPPYVGETELRYAFKKYGEIQSITFNINKLKKNERNSKMNEDDNNEDDDDGDYDMNVNNKDRFLYCKLLPYCFKIAYVVFKKTSSCTEALKATELNLYNTETGVGIIKSGIDVWMEEYLSNITDENTLQNDIDKYMKVYDEKINKQKENEKSEQIDEDGWIKVTKSNKYSGFEQNNATVNKLEEKLQKKNKKTELKNFYTFQIKESKMKNIVNLRKKFEKDKEKLEALKKSRRFKPF